MIRVSEHASGYHISVVDISIFDVYFYTIFLPSRTALYQQVGQGVTEAPTAPRFRKDAHVMEVFFHVFLRTSKDSLVLRSCQPGAVSR